ncbi:MAG TPA: DUF4142 domain-containing protein [Burkholderiaceae bacterium]|jgi:putative membrane protein|nr:DUF4142 domain-containing protein [Burkholderiaceae bacterium]
MSIRHPRRLAIALALATGMVSVQAQTTSTPTAPQSPAATGTITTPPTSPGSPTTARNNAGTAAGQTGRLARQDRSFVEDAAESGMAEVQMGKLAQQRASNPEVRRHGERMVADHSKANEELTSLAQAKGIKLPSGPSRAQQRMHDNMAKLQGDKFDRLYMAQMVSDHRKAVSLFEKEARSGDNADLKAFAQKTLPTLQEHLKLTETVNASLKQKNRR